MRRTSPLAVGLTLGALLCGCGEPPVVPTQDRRQNVRTSRIEGSVVVTGTVRGNTLLFLYDAARPPPPAGTGRPLTFLVLTGQELFAGAASGATGPFVAPFTFSQVPPGRYLIRGFIDRECQGPASDCRPSDFNPWYGVTAEPNKGDVGGGAFDLVTRQPRVLEIGEDLEPVRSVIAVFEPSALTTVPADRPVFSVTGSGAFDPTLGPLVLGLAATPLEEGPISQGEPIFLARYVDANGDGVPEDGDGDGVVDFWPRVVVRKLADADPLGLTDQNDLDGNGILDADAEDYPGLDGTLGGAPNLVVLAARFLPDPVLAALTDAGGAPLMITVPFPQLTLAIAPLALDVSNPAAPRPLQSVPSGRYAVVVLQATGQTWRVPNELSPEAAAQSGLPAVASQAFVIEVP